MSLIAKAYSRQLTPSLASRYCSQSASPRYSAAAASVGGGRFIEDGPLVETLTKPPGQLVIELREALPLARRLRDSQHPLVARTGARMVAMIVETLYEIDVTLADPLGELE